MKKVLYSLMALLLASAAQAQDFKTNLASARTAYSAGNLEQAHFALQQSLQELDIIIGKEVLKLLPEKLDTMAALTASDEVRGNVSFIGASIQRYYGKGEKNARIEIVNNSPLLGALNSYLMSPMITGLASDGKTKVVKVQGYKARLERIDGAEGKAPGYRVDIPFNSALVSLHLSTGTDAEALNMANAIPLAKIAKLIQ